MTKEQAVEYVRDHSDNDTLDDDEVREVYAALYGCDPDEQDEDEGLWSHCCAAAEAE